MRVQVFAGLLRRCNEGDRVDFLVLRTRPTWIFGDRFE